MGPVAVVTSTECSVMIMAAVGGGARAREPGESRELMRTTSSLAPLSHPPRAACYRHELPARQQPATQVGPAHQPPLSPRTSRPSSTSRRTAALGSRRSHPRRTRRRVVLPWRTATRLSERRTASRLERARPPPAPARTAAPRTPSGLPAAAALRPPARTSAPLRLWHSVGPAAATRLRRSPSTAHLVRPALPAGAPPPSAALSSPFCAEPLRRQSSSDDRRRLHPLLDLLWPRALLLLVLLSRRPSRRTSSPAAAAAAVPRAQAPRAAAAARRLVLAGRVHLFRPAQGRARARGGPALDLPAGQGAQGVGREPQAQGGVRRCLLSLPLPLCGGRASSTAGPALTRSRFCRARRAVIEGTGIALDTPEAVARWIEERKKRWPSKKVVDEKVRLVSLSPPLPPQSRTAALTLALHPLPPPPPAPALVHSHRRSAPAPSASQQASKRPRASATARAAGAGAGGSPTRAGAGAAGEGSAAATVGGTLGGARAVR